MSIITFIMILPIEKTFMRKQKGPRISEGKKRGKMIRRREREKGRKTYAKPIINLKTKSESIIFHSFKVFRFRLAFLSLSAPSSSMCLRTIVELSCSLSFFYCNVSIASNQSCYFLSQHPTFQLAVSIFNSKLRAWNRVIFMTTGQVWMCYSSNSTTIVFFVLVSISMHLQTKFAYTNWRREKKEWKIDRKQKLIT